MVLPNVRLERDGLVDRRGTDVGHFEGRRHIPDDLAGPDLSPLATIGVSDGGANGMAIDEGGDDASIQDMGRPGGVMGGGLEGAHRLVPGPEALEAQTLVILGAASPAEVGAELILESALGHAAFKQQRGFKSTRQTARTADGFPCAGVTDLVDSGSARELTKLMKRLLREPLTHFLALGAALFLWYGVSGGGPAADNRIAVTPAQIDQMVQIFGKTWQRPPTPQELQGLIDDFVREEVLFREASAMGLDRDDTIIRRRLRQKLEFLAEDLTPPADPTDEQLQEFMNEHPELFRVEPRVSFRHIYFSRDRRADAVADDARQALGRLRAGADPAAFGDPLPMPADFESVTGRDVASLFGQDFAGALPEVKVGEWTGPVESGYGLHLVLVRDFEPGRLPELEEAREDVEREWASARRREANEAFYQTLRERYTVSVELPEWAQALPAATESAP